MSTKKCAKNFVWQLEQNVIKIKTKQNEFNWKIFEYEKRLKKTSGGGGGGRMKWHEVSFFV